MKRTLLVALLGMFIFTSLDAQIRHRFTGPGAKNYKYWRQNKLSYEPMASLNGRTMVGRSTPPMLRKAKLKQHLKAKPRITGPRAKNTPHRLRRKAGQ